MKIMIVAGVSALAVALMPIVASATTYVDNGGSALLSNGDYGGTFQLNPGASATYSFQVSRPTRVSFISMGATSTSLTALESTLFGINTATTNFDTPTPNGSGMRVTYSAQGSLPDFTTKIPFTLIVDRGLSGTAGVTGGYSFQVSTVPVPAAGGLMLTGFGLFALLAMRRRRQMGAG